ncbi:MAG: hypothetical protein EPO52_17400 [Herbiconiux sp.]|uniref:SatD family protein n=1 Tax=Herbiconiux sp. TaxID=1871186 RepID=UPI001224E269|nr:SatD family protein [Herbiconiux sp.]TAJ46311.1 MAG: hypothetical protein EPO52_17400 [Herbiconiux sp.]
MDRTAVAVIADIVDSRKIADRRSVQAEIVAAFSGVNSLLPGVQNLHPTVGDEFQALYSTVPAALEATLLARLALPEGIDCRFGMGLGAVSEVGQGSAGPVQDGAAWWLAREAIDEAHDREKSRTPSLRGWFREAAGDAALEPAVNAYLLARDHIVGSMKGRARRLTFGALCGLRQDQLAAQEGITQSAVSQALRRSGGASLIAAIDELGLTP